MDAYEQIRKKRFNVRVATRGKDNQTHKEKLMLVWFNYLVKIEEDLHRANNGVITKSKAIDNILDMLYDWYAEYSTNSLWLKVIQLNKKTPIGDVGEMLNDYHSRLSLMLIIKTHYFSLLGNENETDLVNATFEALDTALDSKTL